MRSYKLSWLDILWSVVSLIGVLALTYYLVITDSRADDYVSGMLGVFNSGKSSLSESKLLNLGHREMWGCGLASQYEIGGWSDSAGYGRKSSLYGAYQVGVEAGDSIKARVMFGPALISSPDAYLGGVFQFSEDFFIGLSGSNGNTIGLMYKHFSSAGLEKPNEGRDYAGVSVSLPW